MYSTIPAEWAQHRFYSKFNFFLLPLSNQKPEPKVVFFVSQPLFLLFLQHVYETMIHLQFSVVANVVDCDIVVSEFELQSRYYVHFRKEKKSIFAPQS